MPRQVRALTTILALLITGLGFAGLANAQDCPRGDLDKAYCDRDGDLVADIPTDPKHLANLPTIIFSYTPVEDPAVYQKVWDGFIKHMEKVTGRKVVFFPVQSNAAQLEAMRSGRLHVAGVNTGGNPIAVNCAGFVPFAIMANKNGIFGYEMEIIVPSTVLSRRRLSSRGRKLPSLRPPRTPGSKRPLPF